MIGQAIWQLAKNIATNACATSQCNGAQRRDVLQVLETAAGQARQIFQPQLLLRAADAGRPEAYAGLARLLPQDEYISETTRRLALAEAERLLAAESREAAWEALGLLAVGAADAELPSRLQGLYALMAPQLQGSSIWTVPVDPVYESRRSLVRVLVAAADAPEIARQAAAVGAKALWLQLDIRSEEARRIAGAAGMDYVEDECTAVVASLHRIRKTAA